MKSTSTFLAALALSAAVSASLAADGAVPYKASADGKKIDAKTYAGYSKWTSSACVACHGRDATGGAGGGPDILVYLKKSPKEQFMSTVLEGRPGTAMVGWKSNAVIADNVDAIYAYLKGRSDGAIAKGSLDKLE